MSQTKPTLRATKDYGLFTHSRDNRPTDLSNRKGLLESMQKYGFLPAYPIHCVRARDGKMEIRDGQHRFAMAQKLGLPVWYVVLADDVSVPEINNTQKAWTPLNYAQCFAAQGNQHYADLIEFAKKYAVPVTLAAAILAGTACPHNIRAAFASGEFVIKTPARAHSIAHVFSALVKLNRSVRNARLLEAIYAVSHIKEVEMQRIVEGATRCPEKLVAYGTKDGYLEMLEELYNFGRRVRVPIKIPAENAMKERNPARPRTAA